jgi:hypothetical protein
MSKVIIGIDPSAQDKGHGCAFYPDGKLFSLEMYQLMDLHFSITRYLELNPDAEIEAHIENVKGKKAAWHNKNGNKKSISGSSQDIGKCKQAQVELERMLKYLGVKIVRHPVSSMWKSQDSKIQFQKVTGWKGRSNEDTRSAAYFGFLGCK